MKKMSMMLCAALAFGMAASQAKAADLSAYNEVQAQVVQALATANVQDLINWKVGDKADYKVTMGFLGNGTMHKEVMKQEGDGLWVDQDMDLSVQKQKVEILINKKDGKIMKLIVNGQEQQVPDENIEVISQDYTEVTVPAGTFKVLHIVAKSKESPKMEIWANPKDVVMDGGVKTIMATQFGIDITMELTGQTRGM